MDFHESIDQARDHIGKAKASYCLCDYESALASLLSAYSNVRQLIEHVYKQYREALQAELPAGEDSGKEKLKCRQHPKP